MADSKKNNLFNKKVLVVGWAKSGKAAVNFLLKEKAAVYLFADPKPILSEAQKDVTVVSEENIPNSIELVVKNPGIHYSNTVISKFIEKKVPVIVESEMALQFFEGKITAVTGSNGKTTITTLIQEMSKEDGKTLNTAGNIGTPVSEVLIDEEERKKDLLIELSSFQLVGSPSIHPNIAVISNIFSSHLDFHKTREEYIEAKSTITSNQTQDDVFVYNDDQNETKIIAENSSAKKMAFSTTHKTNGAYFFDSYLWFDESRLIEQGEILLPGEHNRQNIAAAVTAAKEMDISEKAILKVLRTFSGVKHRLEKISGSDEIEFYNDSKATDIEATQVALKSFNRPVVLFAGGLDRGDDFSKITNEFKNHVNVLITFGETKNKIADIGRKAGVENIKVFDDLKLAFEYYISISKQDDIVVLSPAAASWDQYNNFEERGDEFVSLVHDFLKTKRG